MTERESPGTQIPPITGHIPPIRDEPESTSAPAAPPARDRTTDFGLVLLTVIWGVNFAVIKVALDELHPLSFNALRFPVAALTVLAILRLRGPLTLPHRRHWPRIVLLGFLGNIVYQFFFIFGIDGTGAGNAALLLTTTPVWTIILSSYLGHERGSKLVWLGAAGTIAGMTLVIVGGSVAVGFDASTLRGDLLLVGASMVWTVYTVGARGMIREYGSLQVTAWTLWIGTIGIVAVGLPVTLASSPFAELSALAWVGVLYAGGLAVGLAYALWNRGVQQLGNARTSVYGNLVPVVALLVAWIWLSETPTPVQVTGAVIILASVFAARFGGARPTPLAGAAPETRRAADPGR